jgi:hypothetical protein
VKELLLFVLLRRNKKPRQSSRSKQASIPAKAPSPYAAVSIKPGNSPCEAVKRIAGERYLKSEAPSLPLADCDHPPCHCLYVHHEDRRDGAQDRRLPNSLSERLFAQSREERRKRRGRRKTD